MHHFLVQATITLPGRLGQIAFPSGKANLTPGTPNFLPSIIIEWLIGFAGALAVISVIYSGIMYMTAGGDPKKSETAKKNLGWSITGLVVFFLATALVVWVNQLINGTL